MYLESKNINFPDYVRTFNRYNVSAKDYERYMKLLDMGLFNEAIDLFVSKYITAPAGEYSSMMSNFMKVADSGEIKTAVEQKIFFTVSGSSRSLNTLLNENFRSFMSAYSRNIFSETGISSPKVKKTILENTLNEFDVLTRNTLNATESNVLSAIRRLQKEMIIENQKIATIGIDRLGIRAEIDAFRKKLQDRYPDIYKSLETGQIMRQISTDGKITNYKLENYLESAVTTTLLNIDRTSVQVQSEIEGDEIVEYYERDHRRVKSERHICKYILGNKILGKSILAMNPEIAGKLEIMTVDEARGTPDYAMGPFCRHTFRRITDENYLNSIRKLLYVGSIDENLSEA